MQTDGRCPKRVYEDYAETEEMLGHAWGVLFDIWQDRRLPGTYWKHALKEALDFLLSDITEAETKTAEARDAMWRQRKVLRLGEREKPQEQV